MPHASFAPVPSISTLRPCHNAAPTLDAAIARINGIREALPEDVAAVVVWGLAAAQ